MNNFQTFRKIFNSKTTFIVLKYQTKIPTQKSRINSTYYFDLPIYLYSQNRVLLKSMPSLLKIMEKITFINSKSAFTIDYTHNLWQS